MDIYTSKFSNKVRSNKSSYISKLFSRVLLSVILFLVSMIFINSSDKNKNLYQKYVIDKNIKYSNYTKKYNNVFGSVINTQEDEMVFNENLNFKDVESYKEGYSFLVGSNYLIPTLESGIVVFIGEKEDYGNTVIIQGIDGVDIWYSNVNVEDYKLYDYVKKGSILGESISDNIVLVFNKDGINLGYEEYIS